MRALPIIVLVLAILAAVAGWLISPRYRAPADDGEARLRQRAVEYYRASRELDYATMCQLFTPARQLAEAEQLRGEIADKRDTYQALADATKQDLEFAAGSITEERIDLQVEGDWAVVGGTCDIAGESGPRALPLTETVWVRNAGDWWLYSLTYEELNAYGNPPDFAREKFELRSPVMVEQEQPQT